MKAVILAGGFARRLWPLTKDRAKPLLEVGGKPIIQHILEKLEDLNGIDTIYISTNEKFGGQFQEFLKSYKSGKPIKLIVEPSGDEGEKLGAIGGWKYLIDREGIDDELLIIAGDNMFEFSLENFFQFYRKHKSPVVAFYDMVQKEKVKDKYGIAVLSRKGKVLEFQEKTPNPKSTLVATCCYIFPKEIVRLIPDYLKDKNNPDAPGYFLIWLHTRQTVYGYVSKKKWFDIGCFEELEEARKYYC
ncbi:MAG: nucleotidyltransferase family protein [Candidatus Aenigmarchaeota archaeon]